MTMDLWMLVASAGLQFALVMTAAMPRLALNGFVWGLGNREEPSTEMPGWAVRAQKASDNLQENMILAAILILVVHVSGNANATSALGAEIFFAARLVHAGVYMAGVPGLRTAVWSVSMVGLALVAYALI